MNVTRIFRGDELIAQKCYLGYGRFATETWTKHLTHVPFQRNREFHPRLRHKTSRR